MRKPTVLLYSDGNVFGGNEYVVVNILKNKVLNENYDFIFAYRYHRDYQMHLNNLFSKDEMQNHYPLQLWSVAQLYKILDSKLKIRILKILLKIPLAVFNRLQICNIHNRHVIRNFLLGRKIDLIHINNGGYPGAESCLVTAKVAKELGHIVLMQINNIPTQTLKYWDPVIKESVDSFIIASKYTSNRLASLRRITKENVFTLRDQVKLVEPTRSEEEVRKDLGVGEQGILLVQVALLLQYKGQIHTLEAIEKMRVDYPDYYNRIKLVLIGSGEMEEDLKSRINEKNLTDHVSMLGYRHDYIDYVNAADILVHPSRANEDMPLIILSAMSLGKPVISCNFAGIPEEIEHMKSGFLLNPQSESFVDDLENSIPIVYKRRKEFGLRAKNKYNEEFSVKQYEVGLSAIYDKTLIERL